MYKNTYIGKGSALLVVALFVTDAEWEGVSSFTVIRGIGGVENSDA